MTQPDADREALHALARASLVHWGLEGAGLSLHVQSENTVFRVVAPDGVVYALRVHRDGYHDLAELRSEQLFTSELARAGLPVPEAVATRDGQAYATVAFPRPEATRSDPEVTRHVGLVRWIDGVPLSKRLSKSRDPTEVARRFRELGGLIARAHDCSAKWTPPPDFRRHAWDAEGLMGETPFWGRFWEIRAATGAQRSRLLAIRNALLEILSGLDRGPDVYGVIHADVHADNVLVDAERLSIIDFDDAGFGWYVFDLAVALYDRVDAFHSECPHFDLARDALFEGYRRGRPHGPDPAGLFPVFLLVRALMLLRWTEDRPETGMQGMLPLLLTIAFEQADRVGLG